MKLGTLLDWQFKGLLGFFLSERFPELLQPETRKSVTSDPAFILTLHIKQMFILLPVLITLSLLISLLLQPPARSVLSVMD